MLIKIKSNITKHIEKIKIFYPDLDREIYLLNGTSPVYEKFKTLKESNSSFKNWILIGRYAINYDFFKNKTEVTKESLIDNIFFMSSEDDLETFNNNILDFQKTNTIALEHPNDYSQTLQELITSIETSNDFIFKVQNFIKVLSIIDNYDLGKTKTLKEYTLSGKLINVLTKASKCIEDIENHDFNKFSLNNISNIFKKSFKNDKFNYEIFCKLIEEA